MKKSILGAALTLLSLGGCVTAPVHSSKEDPSSSSEAIKETLRNEDFGRAETTYKDADGARRPLSVGTLYENEGYPHLFSISETPLKVLVLPISFTDSEHYGDSALLASYQERLDRVFNEDGGSSFQGVADFYSKSSYGKLTLSFEVAPFFRSGISSAEFLREAVDNKALHAADLALAEYKSQYAEGDHGSLEEDALPLSVFDNDKDGYIDLVWSIYDFPYSTGGSSLESKDFWAFTTYSKRAPGTLEAPAIQTVSFASLYFMLEGKGGFDTHLFIHETGHGLGLNDYYDYSASSSPLGGVDRMDQNIGDHSAYSKFLLGWINPLVVKEEELKGKEAVLALDDFETSGEAILLASPDYNGSAFDEYFLLELVGPNGLYADDAVSGYKGNKAFDSYGIRITHVDARVYGGGLERESYYSDIDALGQKASAFRVDNTKGGRDGSGDYFVDGAGNKNSLREVSLMMNVFESDKNVTNTPNFVAPSSALFGAGDRFYLEPYSSSRGWGKPFMPSGGNLWNKAKTIETWDERTNEQTYTIDSDCTFDFKVRVLSLEGKGDGASATIRIAL